MSKQCASIGKDITKYRDTLGISQDPLSKKFDLPFHIIVKIKVRAMPKPTLATIKKLANALGVFADGLLK